MKNYLRIAVILGLALALAADTEAKGQKLRGSQDQDLTSSKFKFNL